VKKIYINPKYRPAGILLNVKAIIYFKIKLQLKIRNNKNYFSIIVNLHTWLKFRKNKNYLEKGGCSMVLCHFSLA
jgi:hypothetical protein